METYSVQDPSPVTSAQPWEWEETTGTLSSNGEFLIDTTGQRQRDDLVAPAKSSEPDLADPSPLNSSEDLPLQEPTEHLLQSVLQLYASSTNTTSEEATDQSIDSSTLPYEPPEDFAILFGSIPSLAVQKGDLIGMSNDLDAGNNSSSIIEELSDQAHVKAYEESASSTVLGDFEQQLTDKRGVLEGPSQQAFCFLACIANRFHLMWQRAMEFFAWHKPRFD